jgi:hypothetical protein
VDFVRGENVQLVRPQDTRDQAESLRRKFPDVDIHCHVRPNEGQARDHNEDLSYYAEFCLIISQTRSIVLGDKDRSRLHD